MTLIHEPEEGDRRDELTQLLNREGGIRAPAETIGASPGRPCGVLIIDIDHFLPVNERYGHAVGDVALREPAR